MHHFPLRVDRHRLILPNAAWFKERNGKGPAWELGGSTQDAAAAAAAAAAADQVLIRQTTERV